MQEKGQSCGSKVVKEVRRVTQEASVEDPVLKGGDASLSALEGGHRK